MIVKSGLKTKNKVAGCDSNDAYDICLSDSNITILIDTSLRQKPVALMKITDWSWSNLVTHTACRPSTYCIWPLPLRVHQTCRDKQGGKMRKIETVTQRVKRSFIFSLFNLLRAACSFAVLY